MTLQGSIASRVAKYAASNRITISRAAIECGLLEETVLVACSETYQFTQMSNKAFSNILISRASFFTGAPILLR